MPAVIQKYRRDIDGLRTVAVIAVLLFHGFPAILPGGYVGVDCFFVISGYLITGILIEEVDAHQFSVTHFYVRRARRLFPALFVVLLSVLLCGWVGLFPREFEQLGKHVFAGAAFVSNVALWREASYFDTSADLKPLLHLWSLAVEEQYYLLWPVLIYLVTRWRPKWINVAVVALMLISLALSVTLTRRSMSLAFYLPVTRFWELLVGSGLAVFARKRAAEVGGAPAESEVDLFERKVTREACSAVGLLLLALSMITFDRDTAFPGFAASVPVLATAMIIAAGRTPWFNRQILSSGPFVGIGKISYPLYLWHWPLLAYARIISGLDPLPARWAGPLLLLAFAMSWLTYRWVEAPIRAPHRLPKATRDAFVLWGAIAGVGVLGLVVWAGWCEPRSASFERVQRISQAQADWDYPGDQSLQGDRSEKVLFIGDSHMQQYWPRIEHLLMEHPAPVYSVVFRTNGGCPPLAGINRRSIECARFVDEAFAVARDPAIRTVVLAASWKGLASRTDVYRSDDPAKRTLEPFAIDNQWILDQWTLTLSDWVKAGKKVVVILSSPRGSLVDPQRLVDRKRLRWTELPIEPQPEAVLRQDVAQVDSRVRAAAAAAGAEIVDPFETFCTNGECRVATADGEPIFIDSSHIRAAFSRESVRFLDQYVFANGQPINPR